MVALPVVVVVVAVAVAAAAQAAQALLCLSSVEISQRNSELLRLTKKVFKCFISLETFVSDCLRCISARLRLSQV
jgi:hypothetical protein